MVEKQFLSNQKIIDCLNRHYAISVTELTRLALGADIDAEVYKAQADDQSLYFVKLKRGHDFEHNLALQIMLGQAGIQEVICPVTTKDGTPAQHIDDFTLIVFPFIQGQDGFARDLTDDHWVSLGRAMRRVHECSVPPALKNQIAQESYSPTSRDFVRSLYAHIQTEPLTGDEISKQFVAFMKEHEGLIKRLVDRAEQLCTIIQGQSVELVLCHSDIHAGNVLIASDDTLYIVDWDQPIMAPKERDLMFIGGGVGNVWNNPRQEELFYQGYGDVAIDRTILAYYRYERIVQDIAEYCQALLLTMAGDENRAEMYKHFIGMFEPRGVVDIAFQTDKGLSLFSDQTP